MVTLLLHKWTHEQREHRTRDGDFAWTCSHGVLLSKADVATMDCKGPPIKTSEVLCKEMELGSITHELEWIQKYLSGLSFKKGFVTLNAWGPINNFRNYFNCRKQLS